MKEIKSFDYNFSNEDIEIIKQDVGQLLESKDYLTMGRHGRDLEKNFSLAHQAKFASAVNSGTSAIEAILRALDVDSGEVIVPTNTFTATIIPVINVGATPVFVDCDEELNFSYKELIEKVSAQTRAVIIVHIGGYISKDILKIKDFCTKNNIFLIEDCAHAHGSEIYNFKASSFGIAGAFSFFSTKVVSGGEGGIVVTSSKQLDEKIKIIRNHGQDIDNVVDQYGNNWRMSEVHAILINNQLNKFQETFEKRNEIAKIYDRLFSDCDQVRRIKLDVTQKSSFYKYICFVDESLDVKKLHQKMAKENIHMGGYVYPIPCHEQGVFKYLKRSKLKNSEFLCRHHFCPPIYPGMQVADVERVALTIMENISSCLK